MPDDQVSCAGLGSGEKALAAYIRVSPGDHVAIALRDMAAGEIVSLDGREISLKGDVPKGHKIALYGLEPGDEVRKFGFCIGKASTDIAAG
eukprot:gene33685-43241_t